MAQLSAKKSGERPLHQKACTEVTEQTDFTYDLTFVPVPGREAVWGPLVSLLPNSSCIFQRLEIATQNKTENM
jgi:hypothetical protein